MATLWGINYLFSRLEGTGSAAFRCLRTLECRWNAKKREKMPIRFQTIYQG
jgi:hypothetical protein